MKLGILTIHHAYNYGAMLQAYATYIVFKKYKSSVVFVNYDTDTFASQRNLFLPFNTIGNVFRNIRTLIHFSSQKRKIARFEKFYSLFHVSNNYWLNDFDFSKENFDAIITGSDQTFNLFLTGVPREMEAFFLEKVGTAKRASYGSSMGEKLSDVSDYYRSWMQARLQDFTFLSVRDKASANFVESLIGIRPRIVLDPTLLIQKPHWDKLIVTNEERRTDYILFYTVLSEKWVIDYVKKISLHLCLPVIALHPKTRYEVHSDFHYINDAGPQEFLTYIKNARYVITTSYHATIFSIIMGVRFLSLKIGKGNRIVSLLELLGLEDRIIDNQSPNVSVINRKIDYEAVNKILDDERSNSFEYIKKMLDTFEANEK